MNNFKYLQASSSEQAIQNHQSQKGAAYIAGGTNLLDLWKYDLSHPDLLVDINRLSTYRSLIREADGTVIMGALMSNADTAYHPIIEEDYPLLSKAILAGASPQIRNMATNGGNLLQRTRCYYFYDAQASCNKRNPGSGCAALHGYNRIHAILGASENCIAVFPSDMSVALAALSAVIQVSGPDGERQIPFPEFHRLPGNTPEKDNNLRHGELITAIKLPSNGFNSNYSYLKLRDRHSYAFALVSVATGLELDGDRISAARIAVGGVAHRPWRVQEAEEFLQQKVAEAGNFAKAADIILQDAKGYTHNQFKINLAKKAIIRNCMMALEPETQTPGAKPSC